MRNFTRKITLFIFFQGFAGDYRSEYGGFGFIQGNNLQNDWNTTDQIEEVRSQ